LYLRKVLVVLAVLCVGKCTAARLITRRNHAAMGSRITWGKASFSRNRYTFSLNMAKMGQNYGPSARVKRPDPSVSASSEFLTTTTTKVSEDSTLPRGTLLIASDENSVEIRITEEVKKEEERNAQLESLLVAFNSAVLEKEQLITLEVAILAQMEEVRGKISDAAILAELDRAAAEKTALIEAERGICQEISAVALRLKEEMQTSRRKLAELEKNSMNADVTSVALGEMIEVIRACAISFHIQIYI
jgi:DNA-binding protein YbaB